MDAFAELGLERRLVLPAEEPGKAFRAAGSKVHPDAGGSEAAFARAREAQAILASPAKRLRHWLELEGKGMVLRGAVSPELMDLFSRIGALRQVAETMIRQRAEAKSALALALTEAETQGLREKLEKLLGEVEAGIEQECACFPEIEAGHESRAEVAARNLAFLEKWRAALRALFSGLV